MREVSYGMVLCLYIHHQHNYTPHEGSIVRPMREVSYDMVLCLYIHHQNNCTPNEGSIVRYGVVFIYSPPA